MAIIRNAVNAMEKYMTPKSIKKSNAMYFTRKIIEEMISLRKKLGKRQIDMKSFSQEEVSNLERRDDIHLTTMIRYLHDLGVGFDVDVTSNVSEDGKFVLSISVTGSNPVESFEKKVDEIKE